MARCPQRSRGRGEGSQGDGRRAGPLGEDAEHLAGRQGALKASPRSPSPLTSLGTQDRIRRRIREDLRSTANEHGEYKGVVQRLRKMYERKVEELQHHEEAETAKDQDPAFSSKGGKEEGWPPEHWLNHENGPVTSGRNRSDSAASSKAGGSASDIDSPPSSAVSPALAPVFVSGATSSSSAAPSAYRDPPTGKQNVFEAIAKRDWSGEKHRVNSIVRAVGNLAKGADPATALGPSRTVRNKQYGSKLKREAEQAGAFSASLTEDKTDDPLARRPRLPIRHFPA